jgi:hypothetical protein
LGDNRVLNYSIRTGELLSQNLSLIVIDVDLKGDNLVETKRTGDRLIKELLSIYREFKPKSRRIRKVRR